MPTPTLTRTSTGLLAKVDFSNPAGITLGPNWSLDGAAPSMVCFDASPLVAVAPTASTSIAGGVREAVPVVDLDGSWCMLLGAGDGTGTAPGDVWRPQLVTLADRGAGARTLVGDLGIGLWKDPSNHAAGSWAARDLGDLVLYQGAYSLQCVAAGAVTQQSGAGVPSEPYQSDCLTSTASTLAASAGSWSLVGMTVVANPSAGFDHLDALGTARMPIAGAWANYYSATDGSGNYQIGLTLGPNPNTAGTKTGSAILPGAVAGEPENFKPFYVPGVGFVAICNQVAQGTGSTDRNRLFVSSNYAFSDATYRDIQRLSPADGSNAIGLGSPVYSCVTAQTIVTPDGYVPFAFDSGGSGHSGRSIYWAVLEPSPYRLHYAPASTSTVPESFAGTAGTTLAGHGGWTEPIAAGGTATYGAGLLQLPTVSAASPTLVVNSAMTGANFTATAAVTTADACGICYVFSYVNASNYKFIDITFTGGNVNVSLYEVIAGVQGSVQNSQFIGAAAAGTLISGTLTVSDASVSLRFPGLTAWNYTLATGPAPSGQFGFCSGNGGTGARTAGPISWTGAGTPSTVDSLSTITPTAHASHWGECSLEIGALYAGGYVGVDLLVQSSGDSYRLALLSGGGLSLRKSTGGSAGVPGTYTQLQASSGSLVSWALFHHRLRWQVTVSGGTTTIKAWLDGEQQINFADSTSAYASGMVFRAVGNALNCSLRLFHARASGSIQVTGLTNGQSITFRGPGSIPLETATASGTSYTTTTINHYPIYSAEVAGTEIPIPGYGFGGDALAYSAGSSGGSGPTASEIAAAVWGDALNSADFMSTGTAGAVLKASLGASGAIVGTNADKTGYTLGSFGFQVAVANLTNMVLDGATVSNSPTPSATVFAVTGLPAGLASGDLTGMSAIFQSGNRVGARRLVSGHVRSGGVDTITLATALGAAPLASDTLLFC